MKIWRIIGEESKWHLSISKHLETSMAKRRVMSHQRNGGSISISMATYAA